TAALCSSASTRDRIPPMRSLSMSSVMMPPTICADTLSLHDALPISIASKLPHVQALFAVGSSYARSMAFSAATVFALGAVVALLGRERRGVAFGRGHASSGV